MSMFPHDKLDWSLSKLERLAETRSDDLTARLDLALHCLSKAQFHGGGEMHFNKALTAARRVLQHDPANAAALVAAGIALVGLERLEPASRHLDEAMRIAPERADVHLGLGLYHVAMRRLGGPGGDRHQAVREFEWACRQAPDAWEAHHLLGKLLWDRASELGATPNQRLLERSQFHTVKALELAPDGDVALPMVYHLAITCMHTGRYAEANKLFTRLLESEGMRTRAQYYLGLVNYHLQKYKSAVLYLRQHLHAVGENPRVLSRIGMCYLQLNEVSKAREACNRALAIDPGDLQARWTLACALVEEDRDDDALKTFKQILQDAPDHAPAFQELVSVRARRGESAWLQAALRAEVTGFDRLPVAGVRLDQVKNRKVPVHPRESTRDRIGVLISSLSGIDRDAATPILEAMDLTTDESLRFQLWEASLDHVSTARAKALATKLGKPGAAFGAEPGREVLALARDLPEHLLTHGLNISEEDLRRQAVDRHGPARDVEAHRVAIDEERREARAWQALLLLAIASHNNRSSRNLLVRWAAEADADLADAARAALAMLGDASAASELRKRARSRGAENLVDAMLAQVTTPHSRHPVRPAESSEGGTCSACNRQQEEVLQLMVGAQGAICDRCVAEVASHRRELLVDDPNAECSLSRRGAFETAAMYKLQNLMVSREVIDHSLGLLEREAVARYLAR